MIDARAGLLPADRPFAELARRSGKPVILVANKAEGGAGMAGAYEAFGLGLGDPVPLSAEHGEGLADLYEALEPMSPCREDRTEERGRRERRQAASGRRRRAAQRRQIDAHQPLDRPGPPACRPRGGHHPRFHLDRLGLARTAVKLFDTAGLRKRARVEDKLEKLSVADALRAVRFAEVVVALLDATIPFEKQDLSIVDLVEQEGRALVIGLNKWDLVADRPGLLKELREKAARLLPQVKGAPVVPLSGLAGEGLDRLMDAVLRVHEVWNRRIATAKLNQWLADALAANPPPAVSGRRIKIRYMTQAKARPPHFALFGNQLDALPKSYTRYLVNGLRETFDLPGVPIRMSLRMGEEPVR